MISQAMSFDFSEDILAFIILLYYFELKARPITA